VALSANERKAITEFILIVRDLDERVLNHTLLIGELYARLIGGEFVDQDEVRDALTRLIKDWGDERARRAAIFENLIDQLSQIGLAV
jgi:hypothetical protein